MCEDSRVCGNKIAIRLNIVSIETNRLREQRHYRMIKLNMIQIVEF